MAAHRKRPVPSARMADLLAERKRDLLDDGVQLTRQVFEAEWAACWEVMVEERAWPHATEHRRQWRAAMIACKSEMRAAFLDLPTKFGEISEALTAAAERQEITITASELPTVFLGAIAAYGATSEDEVAEELKEAMRA